MSLLSSIFGKKKNFDVPSYIKDISRDTYETRDDALRTYYLIVLAFYKHVLQKIPKEYRDLVHLWWWCSGFAASFSAFSYMFSKTEGGREALMVKIYEGSTFAKYNIGSHVMNLKNNRVVYFNPETNNYEIYTLDELDQKLMEYGINMRAWMRGAMHGASILYKIYKDSLPLMRQEMEEKIKAGDKNYEIWEKRFEPFMKEKRYQSSAF